MVICTRIYVLIVRCVQDFEGQKQSDLIVRVTLIAATVSSNVVVCPKLRSNLVSYDLFRLSLSSLDSHYSRSRPLSLYSALALLFSPW